MLFLASRSFIIFIMVIFTVLFMLLIHMKYYYTKEVEDYKSLYKHTTIQNKIEPSTKFQFNMVELNKEESVNRVKSLNHTMKMRLLKDNELKNGEVQETDKSAPDVIVKYDTGMFGLVDSESTLHVWRAPFPSFGRVWPQPASLRVGKDVFTLCESSEKFYIQLTGVSNYILQAAVARYTALLCDRKQVSYYPYHWRNQEPNLDLVNIGDRLLLSSKSAFIKNSRDDDKGIPRHKFLHQQQHQHAASLADRFKSAVLKGKLTSCTLHVETQGESWPSLGMNESYSISVSRRGLFITSRETWGALRALETLSQMTWRTKSGRIFLNESRVYDQPRFRHRGIMLDTSRHYLPKKIILKNLEAMAMHKFNVFHWHITDDQSFPLLTDNYPEIALKGSYDPVHKVYRPDDVREIVEFARVRGIRVIPEIDTPSHSLSWRHSHPEILTRCLDSHGKWTGHYGPLNMAAESTYKVLEGLMRDVVNLFPDRWVHLGSDEVASSCVESNHAIQEWMRARGMYSTDILADFYLRKLQNIITSYGKTDKNLQRNFIVWQEAYDRNSVLKKGTIVQMWKSQSPSEAAVVAKQSIPVIYSSCWYLDRLEYGAQWATHYMCDPVDDNAGIYNDYGVGGVNNNNNNLNNNQLNPNDYVNNKSKDKINSNSESWKDFILGGEAAMWNEFFDADNVLPRIWPLASAAAERLWSSAQENNPETAALRLEEMRCRLLLRNIPTGVASGAGNCPQSSEESLNKPANVNSKDYLPLNFQLSGVSSIKLLIQLFHNGFKYSIFPITLLLVVIFICIYLRLYVHFSTRKMMLILTICMSVYVIVLITSSSQSTF